MSRTIDGPIGVDVTLQAFRRLPVGKVVRLEIRDGEVVAIGGQHDEVVAGLRDFRIVEFRLVRLLLYLRAKHTLRICAAGSECLLRFHDLNLRIGSRRASAAVHCIDQQLAVVRSLFDYREISYHYDRVGT